MACDGDKTQICGGPNRLTLYYYGTANLQSGASTTSPAKASTTNSAKAQTSTAAAATGWKLLGCYTDTVAARTLPVGVPVAGGAAAMTPQLCTAACQAAGYVLSGTEYSDECYCGNTLQNGGGPAPDGNALCDMTCDGDKTQICGGPNRLTLYSYGAVSLPSGVPTTTTPVASTTTSGAGATGLPAGWKYAACYLDNAFGRILGNEQPDNAALTVQSCVATCAGLGYTIAGLEFSTQCFCDNDIINGGVVATTQSDCNMACSGNANEICGGPNRMSIYAIGPITIFQPPTALTTGLPTNWQYQGCVTDSGASRTLPYQNILTNNNTAQACITLCQTFGYSAAGVEYSDECYCGDQSDFAASGSTTAPSTDCSFTCSGDPHQLCGGPLRMSYYTWEGATPLVTWHTPTGAAAGLYQFLIGGVVIPLITTLGINNKVTFVEKWGTGPPNSTGAYELDLALVNNFAEAWRPMHVKTDVFCSAGLTLPDKAGRQINIGGWSLESTYGIRLYIPDGSPGVPGTNDWQENYEELSLQEGRWYPAAMILANGSMLVVGGEAGSNGTPVPSLEILPRIPGGSTVVTLPFLLRTDPYNLYPFLFVLPSGGVFIAYYNEARILDEVTFATDKVLPNIPAAVNNFLGGRTYPLEGTAVMLPQYPPYTAPVTILICGGSTPYGGNALDNCASTQPEVANPVWTLERMPSRRVMSCITALPDGTYLILNGAEQGEAGFGLGSDPNQNALLYDPTRPVNSRISIMANTTIARLYHSESMLLPDGRVLVSGSDPEDNVHPQEYRVEVFLPPYLLSGLPQPTYTVSSTDWTYNQVVAFTVTSGSTANLRVSLMAAVSSTHGNSLGQRTLFPAWQCAGNTCSFTVPPNNHVAPPGWYQMFILDGPTPSHNTWVRIGGDPAQLGNWPNFPDFTLPGI
jgi:hypothetical protein